MSDNEVTFDGFLKKEGYKEINLNQDVSWTYSKFYSADTVEVLNPIAVFSNQNDKVYEVNLDVL
jgi:hypothetical protein